jgi:hypothetical protein
MAGPWEKYQAAAPAAAGPWTKYATAPQSPAPMQAPPPAMDSPAIPPAADDPAYSTPTPPPAPPQVQDDGQTNFWKQLGSGAVEGLTDTAGFVANAFTGPVGRMIGYDAMQGVKQGREQTGMVDTTAPQTGPQRIARRVGQDVGGSVVGVPFAGPAAAIGGGIGSGLAGGLTAEVTSNPWANMAASMAGGLAGGALLGPRTPKTRAPSEADLRAQRDAAYKAVEKSPARLTPQATKTLERYSRAKTNHAGIDPILHPKATRMQERAYDDLSTPTLRKVEQRRQAIGSDVAGSLDSGERRIGVTMKGAIDDFLGKLRPGQVTGATQDEIDDAIRALRTGRNAVRKLKKSELVTGQIEKAADRASTAGTGGNQINAIRQNIRAILDSPKLRRGFSKEEIAQMRRVVRGGKVENTARWVGRLAPSGGALPLAGNLAAAGHTGGTSLIGSAIGEAAQALGESLTKAQVRRLEGMIRSGKVAPSARGLTDAQRRVLRAVMAQQAARQVQGQMPQ